MQEKTCPVCGKTFVTANPVQKYCSVACRSKELQRRRREKEERQYYVGKCRFCGKSFIRISEGQLYCSDECMQKAAEKNRAEHRCEWCGKPFNSVQPKQRYCSAKCLKMATKRRSAPTGTENAPAPDSAPIRSFQCAKCGKPVNVYDPKDQRTKFCCAHCERLYYKHPRKEK